MEFLTTSYKSLEMTLKHFDSYERKNLSMTSNENRVISQEIRNDNNNRSKSNYRSEFSKKRYRLNLNKCIKLKQLPKNQQ